jgi:hypothetical protein
LAELETILALASEDLLLNTGSGRVDATVRDHSVRVARTAVLIAELVEHKARHVDRTATFAAGLYHDAGWIADYREARVARKDMLSQPTTDVQREVGAGWLERRLAEHIGATSLTKAASAIRQCNGKDTDQVEAQLIAEAENLDEIGPLSIAKVLRDHADDPRGLDAVIATWHRQQEYHYWPARIKDCFRFNATRRLAEQRLAQLDPFMHALTVCHRGEDVADLLEQIGVVVPVLPTSS